MERHVLFFDIDNTIYFHGWFPCRIARAIRRAQKAGHYCVIDTGRPKCCLPKSVMKRVKWDGIICAAAYTEFRGEVLDCKLMPRESVEKLAEIIEKENIPAVFDCDGPSYALRCKQRKDEIHSVQEIFEDFEAKRVNKVELLHPMSKETLDAIAPYASCFPMGTYVDVFVLGCTKADGMKLIGEKTGIPRERMIAFGDNNNDLAMLRYAGKSVAMEKASPDAIEAATFHATKRRFGVVEGIKKYLGI